MLRICPGNPCKTLECLYRTVVQEDMNAISFSRLRANLKSACDSVCAGHEPVVVERRNGGDVVLIAREDYDSLNETAYLLRSPANARRLLEAVKRRRPARKSFASAKALRGETGL